MMLYDTIRNEGAMQKAARIPNETLAMMGTGALGGVLANREKSLASKIAGGATGALSGPYGSILGSLGGLLGLECLPKKYRPEANGIVRRILPWPLAIGGAGLGGYGAGKLGGNLASWIENKIKGDEEPQQ